MMTQKPAQNFGQSKGISFIVITSNLELQLHVPKEERFPNPLKYIDVTRTTHANPDVLQEGRIEDDWNMDVDRNLSDSWTRSREVPNIE